jgi:hypothetical protein
MKIQEAVLSVSALLFSIAPSLAQVPPPPPTLIPGSVSSVFFNLSYTKQTPGHYARDENGAFLLQDGKKIPAFGNQWDIYNPTKKTYSEHSEVWTKSTKFKYSNKELLLDMINLGLISGPLTGWSIVLVKVDSWSQAEGNDASYYGPPAYYAVKTGATPVQVPLTVFPDFGNDASSSKFGFNYYYKNVPPEIFDVDGFILGDFVGGGETPPLEAHKYLVNCALSLSSEPPFVMPPWYQNVGSNWLYTFAADSIDKSNDFNFQGIQTFGRASVKRVFFDGAPWGVVVHPANRIASITGTGPQDLISGTWTPKGGDPEPGEQAFGSIVEGKITTTAGRVLNVATFPNVLFELDE